jgi:hypothetical protein
LFEFLNDLSAFGVDKEQEIKNNEKFFDETMQMTKTLTNYIDNCHCEIPSLMDGE